MMRNSPPDRFAAPSSVIHPAGSDNDVRSRRDLLRGAMLLAMAAATGCAKPAPQTQTAEKREVDDFDPLNGAIETKEKILRLPVPFVCQAPTGDWKPPFDEACEETCLFMIEQFLAKNPNIDPQKAEAEIRELAKLVASKGHGIDIGVKTVGEIAAERYKLRAKVYEGDAVTPQNIRRLLAAGHPVVLPVAKIKNQHFKSEAPYHMVIVRGFDDSDKEQKLITNDPGTKRGEGYPYPQSYLMECIHEWDGSRDTVAKAGKAMLVLGK